LGASPQDLAALAKAVSKVFRYPPSGSIRNAAWLGR
jgi:hypothetical protein